MKRRTYEVSSIGEGFLRKPPAVLFTPRLIRSNISYRDGDGVEQIVKSSHCGINLQWWRNGNETLRYQPAVVQSSERLNWHSGTRCLALRLWRSPLVVAEQNRSQSLYLNPTKSTYDLVSPPPLMPSLEAWSLSSTFMFSSASSSTNSGLYRM